MLNHFKAFVQEHSLFSSTHKILVAVSGGLDSVVLAHLLSKAGFEMVLAHGNFGLRGQDSEDDEQFVRNLAQALRVEIHVAKLSASDLAHQKGISIQMAARKLRYDWFETLMNEHQYDFLATAHHLDDSLETSIFNLSRGTGLRGVKGISTQSGKIVRPLMFTGREEIADFALTENIQWREDGSNASDKYQRNLIRHHVVPILKQINPALSKTFRWSSHRLAAANHYFQQVLSDFKDQHLIKKGEDWYLDKNALMQKDYPDVLLSEIISTWNFNYFQAKEVVDCLRATPLSGRKFYAENHWLVIDRKHLIISEIKDLSNFNVSIEQDQTEIDFMGKHMEISEAGASDYILDKNPRRAIFDADLLRYPLTIRRWKQGDWFIPQGMKGRKKLSDFLIDAKMPLNLKGQQFLLCSGDDIVWVIGMRIDDRFKVTDKTKNVKIFEFKIH